MARVEKISEKQFVLDMINKEFELIGSTNHWNTFDELVEWSKLEENKEWYNNYAFTTREQYEAWKAYFLEHIYNWKPKSLRKNAAKNDFSWFALEYGFSYDFDK